MSENEFNEMQQAKAVVRRKSDLPSIIRNPGVARDNWKNRYLVSAKLGNVTWKAFHDYCKENKYNYNAGLNRLLVDHPKLKPYLKENG